MKILSGDSFSFFFSKVDVFFLLIASLSDFCLVLLSFVFISGFSLKGLFIDLIARKWLSFFADELRLSFQGFPTVFKDSFEIFDGFRNASPRQFKILSDSCGFFENVAFFFFNEDSSQIFQKNSSSTAKKKKNDICPFLFEC